MIISYEPILTKIALPEIPGIKKNENATKPLKNIKGYTFNGLNVY